MKLTRPLFARLASGTDPFLGQFRTTRYGPVLASPKYHTTPAAYRRPAQNAAFARAVETNRTAAVPTKQDARALLAVTISRNTISPSAPIADDLPTIETPATLNAATIL